MLDFTKLWDTKYLFGTNPVLMSRSDNIFLWTGAAFVVISIVMKILALRGERQSPARYLWNRFFHNTLTTGLLALLWAGARFENIPWMSTHFLILLIFLIWLIWLGFILKYTFSEYPRQKKIWAEEKLKRRYLP